MCSVKSRLAVHDVPPRTSGTMHRQMHGLSKCPWLSPTPIPPHLRRRGLSQGSGWGRLAVPVESVAWHLGRASGYCCTASASEEALFTAPV